MQLDKASREKYESLLVKLYGAFENNDYESVAEILQEEDDSDLFAQLVRELETGDKYLVYDEMSTEKVLAVYRRSPSLKPMAKRAVPLLSLLVATTSEV